MLLAQFANLLVYDSFSSDIALVILSIQFFYVRESRFLKRHPVLSIALVELETLRAEPTLKDRFVLLLDKMEELKGTLQAYRAVACSLLLHSGALGYQDVRAESLAYQTLIRHVLEEIRTLFARDLLAVANRLGIFQEV